jgi:hypothetical protein
MYETLYNIAKEQKADVIRADYKIFFGNGSSRRYLDKRIAGKDEQYGRLLCAKDDFSLFKNDMSTWAGIYRKKFLLENNIRHNETPGAAYQDNGFWFQIFALAGSIYYVNDSFYRYRLDNPNSSVHDKNKLYAICNEYAFIESNLKSKSVYETLKYIFVLMKFIRYVSSYYRLDDTLKLKFAEKFHEEMLEHEKNHEICRGYFTKEQLLILDEISESACKFHNRISEEKKQFHQLLQSDEIIIQFGCGSDGVRLLGYVKELDMLNRIKCLCDNNRMLQGTSLFDKNICSLEDVKSKYPQAMFVISSLNYAEEIKMQLIDNGIAADRIKVINIC